MLDDMSNASEESHAAYNTDMEVKNARAFFKLSINLLRLALAPYTLLPYLSPLVNMCAHSLLCISAQVASVNIVCALTCLDIDSEC